MGREEQVAPAEKVRSERREGVVVVTIDNPPTAALSGDVRAGVLTALDAAQADDVIKAIVITGSDKIFATGAGLQDTGNENVPSLADLCDRIEASEKPVVVAIAGSALGGGLEVALAAHVRVATPSARLGAPEITLGLLPSAGGTQRMPKVIGGIAALKLLLSGRAVSGETARKLGLVDVLEPDDLVAAAVRHAARLAESKGELRRSSTRRDRLGEGTGFLESVANHRRAADASPLDAPMRMIECVEAALLLPYDIGRGMEQAAYDDLVESEHSKSLRHIFSVERQLQAATRWEGRVSSRPMSGVAVIGAKGIGAELVVQCLDAGFKVAVAEADDETLEDGVSRIIGHYDARLAAGAMTDDAVEQTLDRMQALSGYSKISDKDVVVDPSPVLTKKRVAELDAAMKAGAILIVGGERVDVGTVASMTGRAADVVGMRFFAGIKKNRLVEMAASDQSGPRSVATARAFARKIDRLILNTAPGKDSIGTRISEALHAAADLCLEDGARIGQIDAALRDWGLPHGSFAYRDIIGVKRQSGPRGMEGQRGGGIDAVLASVGRFGISVGRGYYLYRHRGKPGIEDTDIQQMIEADRTAKGIQPRAVTDAEIRFRCVAAMAGAGAQLVAEGIAKRPADIDMVAVHGLGFARRTGGVMFAADLMGLKEVSQQISAMARDSARIPPPPSILTDLIRSKKGFSDLNA
ncbi:MAG: hypothetical protein HKN18_10160 [Silicimonas sp.]|nr:hypothetical protein [Silicimonas sp.]